MSPAAIAIIALFIAFCFPTPLQVEIDQVWKQQRLYGGVGVAAGTADFRPPSLPGESLFFPPSFPCPGLGLELLCDAAGGADRG
jgi:hypothetical protein